MKSVAAIAVVALFILPACPKKAVKPDEGLVTVDGLEVRVEQEATWVAVARPIAEGIPVEAGFQRAFQEAMALALAPAGDPLIIYDGDGRRLVAFPVAGPARLEPPWFMRSVQGGPVATATVVGGLRAAAARNDDFLLGIRARGDTVVGPVLHRLLDDPRTTDPAALRVELRAPLQP